MGTPTGHHLLTQSQSWNCSPPALMMMEFTPVKLRMMLVVSAAAAQLPLKVSLSLSCTALSVYLSLKLMPVTFEVLYISPWCSGLNKTSQDTFYFHQSTTFAMSWFDNHSQQFCCRAMKHSQLHYTSNNLPLSTRISRSAVFTSIFHSCSTFLFVAATTSTMGVAALSVAQTSPTKTKSSSP